MPAGTEITEPLPAPASETVTVYVGIVVDENDVDVPPT